MRLQNKAVERSLLLVVFLVLCLSTVSANTIVNPRYIEHDSPLYDEIDALYSLSGMAKPNTDRPWSEAQARKILNRIDKESLSGTGLALYLDAESILNEGLRWKSGDASLSTGIDFTLEHYLHTNESFDTEDEWVRTWSDRKPLMKVYFEGAVDDFFYTYADVLYRKSRAGINDHYLSYAEAGRLSNDGYVGAWKVPAENSFVASSAFFREKACTNFFTDTRDFDFIFPRRAIFSAGGKKWNLAFIRDRMKIGDSHIGNLILDDWSDYNNGIKASFFADSFTYNLHLLTFNTITKDGEMPNDESELFMIHTLDFRFRDKVSLKLSENVMYRYQSFSLEYLNPAFLYHNLNNAGMFNAIALVELNANLLPSLSAYMQFALDQARAPDEGDSQSDAGALILGAEHTIAVGKGVFESYAEYLSTTPVLYKRQGVDFIKPVRHFHQDSDNGSYGHILFFEYIGYRYGGDTRTVKVGTKYTLPGVAQIEGYIQALEHGNIYLYSSHNKDGNNEGSANIKDKTPSGETIKRALILSLKGDCSLSSFFSYPGIRLGGELDWIIASDYTKESKSYSNTQQDLQLTLSFTIEI